MEVPAGQDGIQRLLQAEQEAQAIVTKARQAKSERLKQAQMEAEKEAESYRLQREQEFKNKVAMDTTDSEENVKRLTAEASQSVAAIKSSVSSKKEGVLKLLLSKVTAVDV